MVCSLCQKKKVFNDLCKEHYLGYVEKEVQRAIKDFDLLKKRERVCVAVSGGKDSVVLLYILKNLGYDVSALAIDEGIKGYRKATIDFLEEFCEKQKIPLQIKSFKEETGKDLDEMKQEGPKCNACGTFRRFLLNKHSVGFDKIATGHNLDDEAQAVLMNLFKAQTALFDRQGPKTKEAEGFTQKVKPLYYLKEKEIMVYAFLKGFDVPQGECPYAHLSFRAKIRDFINGEEAKNEGIKNNIIQTFLEIKNVGSKKIKMNKCKTCNFPSQSTQCKACRLKKRI